MQISVLLDMLNIVYSHSDFNRDDIQNYLNLFSFMVNKPYNKLEKIKILLDKAIHNPKTLHYRDFCSKKR